MDVLDVVVVDEGDLTIYQIATLKMCDIPLKKRPDHPRKGAYRYGYFLIPKALATRMAVPPHVWQQIVGNLEDVQS